MALLFFYVNVGFEAAHAATGIWAERKAAAEKLRESRSKEAEDARAADSAPSRVGAPVQDNLLLAQLPSIDLNVLSNVLPKSQVQTPVFSSSPEAGVSQSGVPSAPAAPSASALAGRLPKSVQSVPMSFATLRDVYLPPGWKPGDLMVINVQDAHGNAEAQGNIARIIESFAKAPQPSPLDEGSQGSTARKPSSPSSPLVVGIEGARGAFNFHPYRSFPNRAVTKEVAQYLLKESFITGPEYIGMTLDLAPETAVEAGDVFDAAAEARPGSAQPPVTFWGIEREDLYLKHVEAFKDSVGEQKGAEAKVKVWGKMLRKVKERRLNATLRELDAKMELHRKQQIGLGAYIQFLSKAAAGASGGAAVRSAGGPMIRQLIEALALEESMDFKVVDKERRAMTSALTQKLPRAELKNLVSASLSYRLGHLTHTAFYQYLKQLCVAYGMSLNQWPAMDRYIRYVLISEKIQADALFKEIESLEKAALAANVKSAEEKEIVRISQDLSLVEKLVGFGLSPQEWDAYESRRAEIENIPGRLEPYGVKSSQGDDGENSGDPEIAPADLFKLLSKFEDFNRAAIARNEVLVQNLLAKVSSEYGATDGKSSSEGEKLALMVTGGFHTDGVTKLLREKKVAYAVMMPRLGKVEGDGTEYLDIFSRDKTPLEKIFTGERITLAPQSAAAASPMGEVSPGAVVAERNFAALAVAKLVQEALQQFARLSDEARDQLEEAIARWAEGLNAGEFLTVEDISIGEVKESRSPRGQLDKITIEINMQGRNGQPSTSVAIDLRPKGSDAPAGIENAESEPVQMDMNGDKIGIYPAKAGFLASLSNRLPSLSRLTRGLPQRAKTALASGIASAALLVSVGTRRGSSGPFGHFKRVASAAILAAVMTFTAFIPQFTDIPASHADGPVAAPYVLRIPGLARGSQAPSVQEIPRFIDPSLSKEDSAMAREVLDDSIKIIQDSGRGWLQNVAQIQILEDMNVPAMAHTDTRIIFVQFAALQQEEPERRVAWMVQTLAHEGTHIQDRGDVVSGNITPDQDESRALRANADGMELMNALQPGSFTQREINDQRWFADRVKDDGGIPIDRVVTQDVIDRVFPPYQVAVGYLQMKGYQEDDLVYVKSEKKRDDDLDRDGYRIEFAPRNGSGPVVVWASVLSEEDGSLVIRGLSGEIVTMQPRVAMSAESSGRTGPRAAKLMSHGVPVPAALGILGPLNALLAIPLWVQGLQSKARKSLQKLGLLRTSSGSEAPAGIENAESEPVQMDMNGDKIGIYPAKAGFLVSLSNRLPSLSRLTRGLPQKIKTAIVSGLNSAKFPFSGAMSVSERSTTVQLGNGVLIKPAFIENLRQKGPIGHFAAGVYENVVAPIIVEEPLVLVLPLILTALFGPAVGLPAIVLARLIFIALHLRGSPQRTPNESWFRYVINRANFLVIPTLISAVSLITFGLFTIDSGVLSDKNIFEIFAYAAAGHSLLNTLTPLINRLTGWNLRKGSMLSSSPQPDPDSAPDMRELAHSLKHLSPLELNEHIARNHRIANYMLQFMAPYAISRWMDIGTDKALEEGLDEILKSNLEKREIISGRFYIGSPFQEIEEYLDKDSPRLERALDILKRDEVAIYLENYENFVFSEGPPKSLKEVLLSHPLTRPLFVRDAFVLAETDREKYEILQKLGVITDLFKQDFASFDEARVVAYGVNDFDYFARVLSLPVNDPGLYSLLSHFPNAESAWERLGLAREFRAAFPTDELFWKSERSFIDIYEQLVDRRGQTLEGEARPSSESREEGQAGAPLAFGLSVAAFGLALTFVLSGGVPGVLLSIIAGIAAIAGGIYFQSAPSKPETLEGLEALISDIARGKSEGNAASERKMWERVLREYLPAWENYLIRDLSAVEYAKLNQSVMRLPVQLGPEFRDYLKSVVEYAMYSKSPLGDQSDIEGDRFSALAAWLEFRLVPSGYYVFPNYGRAAEDGSFVQDDSGPMVQFVSLRIIHDFDAVIKTERGNVSLLHTSLMNPEHAATVPNLPAGFVIPGQAGPSIGRKKIYVVAIEETSRGLAAGTLAPFLERPDGRENIRTWFGDEVVEHFEGLSKDEITPDHIEQLMILAVWTHELRHGADGFSGLAAIKSRHENELSAYLAEIEHGPMPHLWALESMRFLFEHIKSQSTARKDVANPDGAAGDLWRVAMELGKSAIKLGMIRFDPSELRRIASGEVADNRSVIRLFEALFGLSTDDLRRAANDASETNFGGLRGSGFNQAFINKIFNVMLSGEIDRTVGLRVKSWGRGPASIFYGQFLNYGRSAGAAPATFTGKVQRLMGRLGEPHFTAPLWETAAFPVLGYALTSMGFDAGFLWATGIFTLLHVPGFVSAWKARAKDRGKATDALSLLRDLKFSSFLGVQLTRTLIASIVFYMPFYVLSLLSGLIASQLGDPNPLVNTALLAAVILPATWISGFAHLFYNLEFVPAAPGRLPKFLQVRSEIDKKIEDGELEGILFIDGNKINLMNQLVGKRGVDLMLDNLHETLIGIQKKYGAVVWRHGGDEYAVAIVKREGEPGMQGAIESEIRAAVESLKLQPYLLNVPGSKLDDGLWDGILAAGGTISELGGRAVVLVPAGDAGAAFESELRPYIGNDPLSEWLAAFRNDAVRTGNYLSLTLSMGYDAAGPGKTLDDLVNKSAEDKDAKKNQGAAASPAVDHEPVVVPGSESDQKVQAYNQRMQEAGGRIQSVASEYFSDQQGWRDALSYRLKVMRLLDFRFGPAKFGAKTVAFMISPTGYEAKAGNPRLAAILNEKAESSRDRRIVDGELKLINDTLGYDEADRLIALIREDVATHNPFPGYKMYVTGGSPAGPLIALVPFLPTAKPVRPEHIHAYAQKIVDAAYDSDDVNIRPARMMTVYENVSPSEGLGRALARIQNTRFVMESRPASSRPTSAIYSHSDIGKGDVEGIELERALDAADTWMGEAKPPAAKPSPAVDLAPEKTAEELASRELMRMAAENYLSSMPREELLSLVRQATRHDVQTIGTLRVGFAAEGSRKWVFRVTIDGENGEKIQLMLAMKKAKSVDPRKRSITDREYSELKKLSGKAPVPTFIREIITNDGFEGFLEEFIEGKTAHQLLAERSLSLEARRNIVDAVIQISKELKGWATRDINNQNFIVRDSDGKVVMVDIGDGRLKAFTSDADVKHQVWLAGILISQYGFTGGRTGENAFIFDSIADVYSMSQTIQYLEGMKAWMEQEGEASVAQYLFQKGGEMFRHGANQQEQGLPKDVKLSALVAQVLLRDINDYLTKHEGDQGKMPGSDAQSPGGTLEQLKDAQGSGQTLTISWTNDSGEAQVSKGKIESITGTEVKSKKQYDPMVWLEGYSDGIPLSSIQKIESLDAPSTETPGAAQSEWGLLGGLQMPGEAGQVGAPMALGLGVTVAGIAAAFFFGASGLVLVVALAASVAAGVAALFYMNRDSSVAPVAVQVPASIQNFRDQAANRNARKAVDRLLDLGAERKPMGIEERLNEAQKQIDLFRQSTSSDQQRSAIKLIALWALYHGRSPGAALQRSVDRNGLARVIQFQTRREMAKIVDRLDRLTQLKGSEKFGRSLGVMSYDYFYNGGEQSALGGSELINLDEAIASYELMRQNFEPGFRMSRGRKDLAKHVWNAGRKAALDLAGADVIDIARDAALSERYESAGPAQALLHKVHRMSETELSILAQGILRQEKRIADGMSPGSRNIFLIDTGNLKLTRDELREALAKHGITPEMFNQVFRENRDFDSYLISNVDLDRVQKNLDHGIKRDTDALYDIVIARARRVGVNPLVRKGELAMDIFTDENIYTESADVAIRILLIVSQTQVVIISQNLNTTLRENFIVAMQQ